MRVILLTYKKKINMEFLNRIINYDLYCKYVSLRIGNSEFTSTIYSKFITKVVFSLIAIYFVVNMISIFERKSLITSNTTRNTYPRPTIPISNNNFKFAFALSDVNGNIIMQSELERYYVPHFYLFSTVNQGGIEIQASRTYYNIRNCTPNDFLMFDENYIKLNNLTMYSCPDEFDFVINGNNDEKYLNAIIFRLDYCDSKTYNTCKTIKEIENTLQGGNVYIYVLDNDVDVHNYSNPFQPYLKTLIIMNIDIYKQSEIDKYFKKIEIETDQSYFISDYNLQQNYQITEETQSYSTSVYLTASSIPMPMFNVIQITVYGKVDTIIRSYDKIWDGISLVGGIMKIIMGIGFLLTKKFNETEESINLIKSQNLINVPSDEETKKKSDKNKFLKPKSSLFNFEISLLSLNRPNNDSMLNPINQNKSFISSRLDKNDIKISRKGAYENTESNNIDSERQINIPHNIDSIMNFKKRKRKESLDKIVINEEETNNNNNKIQNDQIIINNQKTDEENLKFFEENFNKKMEEMKTNHDDFRFSLMEKLKMSLGYENKTKKNIKHDIFLAGKSELNNFLDIEFIIEKLKEVEKIKKVIFNKHQLEIFDLINKFHSSQNFNNKRKCSVWEEQLDIGALVKYLKNKSEIKEINTIDYKLGKFIFNIIK